VGIFVYAAHKVVHVLRLVKQQLSMLGAFRPTAVVSGGLLWSVYANMVVSFLISETPDL
jgi:uncharacterized membrane protein YkgB